MTDNPLEQQLLTDMAEIAKKKGLEYPFNLYLEPEILKEPDGKMVDIKVEAGYPPTIVIPMVFIARAVYLVKSKALYKDRLERALEKLPLLTRTLSNNIKSNVALVLVSDAKKWRRSLAGEHLTIPDSYFEVSYTVTVKERISGMLQTLSGPNPKEILEEAKARLRRIILNDEAMLDFRDLIQSLSEPITIQAQPKSISILTPAVDSNQTEEKRSY